MLHVLQVIGCGVALFMISPKLTLLSAVIVPCIITAGATIGSLLRHLSRKAQAQVGLGLFHFEHG